MNDERKIKLLSKKEVHKLIATETLYIFDLIEPSNFGRDVFASRLSVGHKEFYNAQQVEMRPMCVYEMFLYDYQNEQFILDSTENRNEPTLLRIYRTYNVSTKKNSPIATVERVQLFCVEYKSRGALTSIFIENEQVKELIGD